MKLPLFNYARDIRVILRDNNEEKHYSDDVVIRAIADGFARLWSIRPASRYVDCVLVDVDLSDATLATEVECDIHWRLGVVYFAVARCLEGDIADTVNLQLAQNYFKQADAVFAS